MPQPFNAAQRGFVGKEGRGHAGMGRSNPRSFTCGAHLIRSPLPAPPRQSPQHAHRTATLTYNWQTLEVGLADNFLHILEILVRTFELLSLSLALALSRARVRALCDALLLKNFACLSSFISLPHLCFSRQSSGLLSA